MFNLSRYFSTLRFILIVLAAGLLGPLYQQISLQQMTVLAEDRNVAMAQIVENSLGSVLIPLVGSTVGRDADALRAEVKAQAIYAKAVRLMRNTAVVKINGCHVDW